MKEFSLIKEREQLHKDLIKNLQNVNCYNRGIIEMLIELNNDIDKEYIKHLKEGFYLMIVNCELGKTIEEQINNAFMIIDKNAGERLNGKTN